MPALTAAALKQQIESQLATRIPAALSPMARAEAERQAARDPHLTALLGGGVPVGAITELHGKACSGRTSVALSLAAEVTAAGKVVAWVDVSDELDPETAALCGVDLERLLWVRCGRPAEPEKSAGQRSQAGSNAPVQSTQGAGANRSGSLFEDRAASREPNLVAANHAPRPVGNGGCGSPHPRGEGRGMAEAIDSLLQQQPRSAAIKAKRDLVKPGTPSAPNRRITDIDGKGVSHSIAMVLDKAGHFPTGRSNLVPPSEIVPTNGSLFGRQVERKVSCGSNRLPLTPPQMQTPRRVAMPFPNASPYREEQIPTDRQPSRRAKAAAPQSATPARTQQAVPARGQKSDVVARGTPKTTPRENDDLWAPLDQALRTIDLLLQAGGFSLLVLDLGSVAPDKAWRVPLATWFRFRAGCERSRGSLLVLSQQPCARASADLTVALQRTAQHSEGDRVLTGGSIALQMEQQRRGTAAAVQHVPNFAMQSNVVPFRKPVRSDPGYLDSGYLDSGHQDPRNPAAPDVSPAHTDPHGLRTGQLTQPSRQAWRTGTHWSLPA